MLGIVPLSMVPLSGFRGVRGVFVVIVPTIGSGATITDAIRPDFSGAEIDGWGQASGAWAPQGKQAVWVRADRAALRQLLDKPGASLVGTARDEASEIVDLVQEYRAIIEPIEGSP